MEFRPFIITRQIITDYSKTSDGEDRAAIIYLLDRLRLRECSNSGRMSATYTACKPVVSGQTLELRPAEFEKLIHGISIQKFVNWFFSLRHDSEANSNSVYGWERD